jgi:hypothetical protein
VPEESSRQRQGHLFRRLCAEPELEKAWLEVLGHYARQSLPKDLQEFERRRSHNLARLAAQLREGTFTP